jgi:nitroimidazol reductase NimA-like FMN-containing flavoprotein (pyridoxamine 5'-phosphate oxidase superfamily)
MEPRRIMQAERPNMPAGYGISRSAEGLLPWSYAESRLIESHSYWISTTRPDGRPHVMPVWGVWMDGALYFGTDRGSRKSRNLEANPAVVAHVESADEAVIVEGVARAEAGREALKRLDAAYLAKYKMRLTEAPGELAVWAIVPRVVFAMREKDFPQSATRWRF